MQCCLPFKLPQCKEVVSLLLRWTDVNKVEVLLSRPKREEATAHGPGFKTPITLGSNKLPADKNTV